MRARDRAMLACIALGLGLIGCSAKTPMPIPAGFAVEFRVTNDDGRPLPGAAIVQNKSPLGTTGADGRLTTQLTGTEGTSTAVTVACPDGYSGPAKPTALRLTHTRNVEHGAYEPVRVEFACTRTVRDIVLVVRAQGGSGLALQVDGQPSGITDADGIAHVLLNADRTIRQLTVSLDTSANQYLRPKNPSRVYELSGTDAVLIFDQTFVQAAKPMPRGTRLSSTRHIPYRVD